ncbi:MAG: MTH1187 family thiamine-binding protein [Gammaproteobacteria bacterium]|nr:MTH1187 family thiamine-binding protein [Gammaproteobacteria bacterium]MCZ6774255.1 MTH1187 family thiamine-binding protein [Pseudomonadota bacterium]MCZ6892661.1 MTH1187 family thiamine-binding protein [Gammaproteobacteria bacterium]
MNVMVDLCVVPMGVGVSVSEYIAECERLIEAAGLESELHPYGTVIQGDWDAVFRVVKQCHERVHEMGVPRVFTTLKVGTRTDREQTMADKVDSVRRKLEG